MKGQRQCFDIVGVAAANSPFGFRKALLIDCSLDHLDWKCGNGHERDIQRQVLLGRQPGSIFLNLRDYSFRDENFAHAGMLQHRFGAPAYNGRKQDVSVCDEFRAGSFATN